MVGIIYRGLHGNVISELVTGTVYPMDDECFDMEDGEIVTFTPGPEGWVNQASWDPNVPCVTCGRKDLPLHTDQKCPMCHGEVSPESVVQG